MAVYIHGYDGHCLRAYSYWGDKMPDISMAEEGEDCYSAKVGSTNIYFHADETIEYLGKQYKGKELYDLLINQKLHLG